MRYINLIPRVFTTKGRKWITTSTTNSYFPALSATTDRLKAEGESLAFAWITPRAITKGLEGGILARLLSNDINLIGSRMYSPSEEMIDELIDAHTKHSRPKPFKPFLNYLDTLRPRYNEERGYPNNLMLLLFVGKECRTRIMKAIGEELPDPRKRDCGSTIRGAYGSFRRDESGKIADFEPGLVGAQNDESCNAFLEVFSKFADIDGGVLIEKDQWDECGLVILKPDVLEKPSSRPGHIMDLFSSTGLHLVGARLFSMSIEEAQRFYGHLLPIFAKKLAGHVDKILRQRLNSAFEFQINDYEYEVMTALLKQRHAEAEVNSIIHYMTGIYPRPDMTESDKTKRGTARCLALIYQGPNAIETIRNKLGNTDPKQAQVGTIRSDYGLNILQNGAHASDSLESLHRERKIVGLVYTQKERASFVQSGNAPSDFKRTAVKAIIDTWLGTRNKMK